MQPECNREESTPRERPNPEAPLSAHAAVLWERLAIAIWVVILAIISVRGILTPRANSVYPIFSAAARDWLAGADLYRHVANPYRYSPLVAALLVPFSAFPDAVGGVLWRLLTAGVYLSALVWWSRAVLPRPLSRSQQGLLFLLAVPLSVGSVNNGQSNALVLGLLLAAVAGVARKRWNAAAGCAALASLFKVYPIAVGMLLAAVYPQRFAGRLALALGIGLALPFLLQQPDYVSAQYKGWLHHLQTDDRQSLPPGLWYRDLRLLCRACHVPVRAEWYQALQLAGAAGCAALCLARHNAGWPQRRLLTLLLALGCSWMTLLGSATESCTYILLAPPLAWSVLESWLNRRALWLRIGLLASYGLFTLTQAAVWFPDARRHWHALGLHPLAALIFLVCLLLAEFCHAPGRTPVAGQGTSTMAASAV